MIKKQREMNITLSNLIATVESTYKWRFQETYIFVFGEYEIVMEDDGAVVFGDLQELIASRVNSCENSCSTIHKGKVIIILAQE